MQPRRFEFEDEIWALRPELGGSRWAVQTRNAANRISSFFVVGPSSEIQEISGPESDSWWTELTAFHPKAILISYYQDGSLPVLDGLMAFSPESKDMIWKNANCRLVGMAANSLLCQGLPEQREILLEAKTGKNWPHAAKEIQEQAFSYPKWMDAEDGRQVAHLELDGLVVAAWHEMGIEGHDLLLEIEQKDGHSTRICLEKGMKKLHPEPFMLHQKQVVAIQDRKTLLLIDLP